MLEILVVAEGIHTLVCHEIGLVICARRRLRRMLLLNLVVLFLLALLLVVEGH